MTGDRLQMTDDRLTVAPSSEKPVKYIRRLWWRHLSAKKKKKKKKIKKLKKWQAHVCEENRFCAWKTGFVRRPFSLSIPTHNAIFTCISTYFFL